MVTAPELYKRQMHALQLVNMGQQAEAKRHLRKTLRKWNDPLCLTNLALLYHNDAEHQQARDAIERSVALQDPYKVNHFTKYIQSMIQLRDGNYEEGFVNWEYRFSVGQVNVHPWATYENLWHGEPLGAQGSLLIWSEQGLGDHIMFARFLRQAQKQAGCMTRVVVAPDLVDLLKDCGGIVTDKTDVKPEDKQIPMCSLPRVLGTTLDNVNGEKYLPMPFVPGRHDEEGFKVGLCWSGNPKNTDLADRSMKREELQPVLDMQSSGLVCKTLQYGYDGFEPATFTDTAQAVAACDLVITIDTSVAHLCGAMGVPTWVMLKRAADWRWGIDTDKSPWYDSMKMFRQSKAGNWGPVVQQVATELRSLLNV